MTWITEKKRDYSKFVGKFRSTTDDDSEESEY